MCLKCPAQCLIQRRPQLMALHIFITSSTDIFKKFKIVLENKSKWEQEWQTSALYFKVHMRLKKTTILFLKQNAFEVKLAFTLEVWSIINKLHPIILK